MSSLTVGYPADPTTQMGPIIEPAKGKLLSGLTTLGAGETWLVEPQKLDDTGRLWSPGVRAGVRRGSEFHLTEYFGPILGIMTAATLDEAIAIQNEIDYGLTAGLHSLEPAELGRVAGAHPGRQPLRQPRHHGRHRAASAVRRLEEVGRRRRHQGRRTELPARPGLVADGRAAAPTPGRQRSVSSRCVDAARVRRARRQLRHPAIDRLERALASDAEAWARSSAPHATSPA